jgi:hypothetical protein
LVSFPTTYDINQSQQRTISGSMQKIMSRKFRKPPTLDITSSANTEESVLRKRRRPLQPGEWTRLATPTQKNSVGNYPSDSMTPKFIPSEESLGVLREYASRTMLPPTQRLNHPRSSSETDRVLQVQGIQPQSLSPVGSHENLNPVIISVPTDQVQHRSNSYPPLLLKANSFNPRPFYSEEYDDEDDDENCSPKTTEFNVMKQSPGHSDAVGTRDSHSIQEFSTITNEQILEMIAEPHCDPLVNPAKENSPSLAANRFESVFFDDFNLPEPSDTSEDD